MAKISEAKKRADRKYQATLHQLNIRIKEEKYAEISAAAARAGMSVRAFVLAAIDEKMGRMEG